MEHLVPSDSRFSRSWSMFASLIVIQAWSSSGFAQSEFLHPQGAPGAFFPPLEADLVSADVDEAEGNRSPNASNSRSEIEFYLSRRIIHPGILYRSSTA